mmetsp:Transcript_21101/g.70285  ORF Transcript_21101/g.70285 Transcript_21101/m.70285 type:complete len:232 (-) Transcript_21101:886-1581(-)
MVSEDCNSLSKSLCQTFFCLECGLKAFVLLSHAHSILFELRLLGIQILLGPSVLIFGAVQSLLKLIFRLAVSGIFLSSAFLLKTQSVLHSFSFILKLLLEIVDDLLTLFDLLFYFHDLSLNVLVLIFLLCPCRINVRSGFFSFLEHLVQSVVVILKLVLLLKISRNSGLNHLSLANDLLDFSLSVPAGLFIPAPLFVNCHELPFSCLPLSTISLHFSFHPSLQFALFLLEA